MELTVHVVVGLDADVELTVHVVVGLDVGSTVGSEAVGEAIDVPVADATIKNQMNEMALDGMRESTNLLLLRATFTSEPGALSHEASCRLV